MHGVTAKRLARVDCEAATCGCARGLFDWLLLGQILPMDPAGASSPPRLLDNAARVVRKS